MSEFCVVTTTTDSQAHARALAALILEQGLAACVQIQILCLPVQAGLPQYLDWVRDQTRPAPPHPQIPGLLIATQV